MRDPSFYVSGILDLHNMTDAGERRATWRQSMAALARATSEEGPGPLDGLHPGALVQGVRAALNAGLVDDLDWLAPAAAGAALYELASTMPAGAEQRELGRRVLSRMLEGNAEAFVALATRMALGTGKGLASAPARARVALVVELPLGMNIADGPLSLALVSRRELAREWIAVPSTGSLHARRLAARLLERAAREAARRASQGDEHALRAFRGDAVAQAWRRLLADRESLVWRHVAVARGLLAPWVESYRAELSAALSAELSPTEWRRAATSIAAHVAVSPVEALRLAAQALGKGGLLERDPGAASAFAWGIARAAEAEPDAAGELLEMLLDRAPVDIAEAIVELRMEFGAAPFVDRAMRRALAEVAKQTRRVRHVTGSDAFLPPQEEDDGAVALAMEVARDLSLEPRDDKPLRDQVARALDAFAHEGARAAYAVAKEVLDAAKGAMGALDAVSPEDEAAKGRAGTLARRASLGILRDLDISILERATLSDLLRLGTGADAPRAHEEALDAIRERMAVWILARETRPLSTAGVHASTPPLVVRPSHPMLALRRLRALLHLVDSDMEGQYDDSHRNAKLQRRSPRVARALVERFERDPPSILRRTILAALARAVDALVRVGVCDVSDVLLVVARNVQEAEEFSTLAEASMDPDLVHVLSRYATFVAACAPKLKVVKKLDSLMPPSGFDVADGVNAESARKLAAFEALARDLAPDASGRTEALRTVLLRVHAGLHAIVTSPSLRALSTSSDNEPEITASLESALGALSQLAVGARQRMDPERAPLAPVSLTMSRPLSVAVSRVLAGVDPVLSDHVISACLDEIVGAIPKAIGRLVSSVVWSLVELPVERPSIDKVPLRLSAETLPNWLPARRTLGGFYVLRALGAGAVGTVFVVTRVEDRSDPQAERFALKVPEYSATAARSVSEADFMKMFRDEASALLGVPQHPNLARFVTFDAGSKPKPILVMELVEGMALDRVIESGALDATRAFSALDHVLAGLEAMHSVGVGHLDIKPGNIILRKGEEAVLVDFGLAGRHIRPGCATGPYGAPEVWGALEGNAHATPMAADVYAFGCLAFEVLTGRTLFEADNEMAQIALHVAHDGFPPLVRDLAAKHAALAPVAEVLFSTLRRDPQNRATASNVRSELRRIAPTVSRQKWPFA